MLTREQMRRRIRRRLELIADTITQLNRLARRRGVDVVLSATNRWVKRTRLRLAVERKRARLREELQQLQK